MKIGRSVFAPLVVAGLALATGGWLLQRGASQERNVYFQAQLFQDVLTHVSDHFVDEKDPSALYRMAIDGMLQELGDPHSTFMTTGDYDRLRSQTQGEYGGLGIQIDIKDGWVTVLTPLPGTPAERVGIEAGDRILQVNGVSTRGWTSDDAVEKLRGPRGSEVDLRVGRVGVDEPIPFKLVRENIEVSSVQTPYLLEGGIGYIELTVFSETTTDSLRAAINHLRGRGMRGLILDLRRNPGGLLDEGVSVSDLFLPEGKLVVETRSRIPNQNLKYTSEEVDEYPGLPIVVLVGEFSASASEIVAGALQDHDRALILGETTFGKGSVQTLFPLTGNNWLKLTTARWFTPSGRSIQKPYGIDETHGNVAQADPVGAEGDTLPKDTARPVFRTDGGRKVYGGGGIHPDLVVGPDSLTAGEQGFAKSLQKYGPKFQDVVYRFAIQYAHDHPELRLGFGITPDLLDQFYRALVAAGIPAERASFNESTRWLGEMLAIEISRAKWGNEGWRQRLNYQDSQIRVAADLLRRSRDTASLLAAASRYAAQHAAADPANSSGAEARKP